MTSSCMEIMCKKIWNLGFLIYNQKITFHIYTVFHSSQNIKVNVNQVVSISSTRLALIPGANASLVTY
jgi:hypothetical protein